MTLSTAQWIVDGLRGLGDEGEIGNDGKSMSLFMDPLRANQLNLPEFCTFSLEGGGNPEMPGISPELMEKCATLFEARGPSAIGFYDPGPGILWPKENKAESFLKIARGKSIFRGVTLQEQTYAIGYARYSAISDEKSESIVSASVNIATLTGSAGLGLQVEKMLEEGRIVHQELDAPRTEDAVMSALAGSFQAETSGSLKDFSFSIGKRLSRDCDRLYNYYKGIMESSADISGKKKISGAEINERLKIIRQEYLKKIDDLRIKYHTTVTITPIALLYVRIPCACASFTVQMGNVSRDISIPWNPLTLRPDATFCVQCGRPSEVIRLCREFHWLCKQCWKRCGTCEKEYCPVCKPKGCVHA